jgi:hypothetical protein
VVFEAKLTQCDQINTILENPFINYDTLKKFTMEMLNQTIVKSMQKKTIFLLNVLLKPMRSHKTNRPGQREVIKPINQVKEKTIYNLTTNIFYDEDVNDQPSTQ